MIARLRPHLPLIVLVASLLILFYRLLLGEVIFWGVPLLQFYPWREMAFGLLRRGQLPLWNPLVGNGAPLLANYQVAVLYPPNWLNLLIPTEYAMGLIGVLHLVWGGLGMVAYLRRLGVERLGQGVGALAFALSGYLLGRFGFLSITSTVPWLPWLMWAIDGLFLASDGRETRRRVALLALICGMMLLAGHAQTAAYSLTLAGAYALWRAYALRRAGVAPLVLALGAVVLGVALAAIQLVPTLELARSSQRVGGLDREFAFTYSFSPARFLTLLMPNLFGSPATGDYWGYGAYWEDAVYVGLLTLFLALRSVVRRLRARQAGSPAEQVVPFFALSLLPVFLLALGQNTPVFPWLFDHVPGFNQFQAPTRWTVLAVFALSVLGAVGADGWQTSERGLAWARRTIAVGLAVILGGLLTGLLLADVGIEPGLFRAVVRLGVTVILAALLVLLLARAERDPAWRPRWEALVLIFLAADLLTAHWGLIPTISPAYYHQGSALADALGEEIEGYRIFYLPDDEFTAKFEVFISFEDFQARDRAHWDRMRDSLLPNMGMIDGVASAGNFDPLRVGAYDALMESLEGASLEEALPVVRRMSVAVLLSPSPMPGLERIARAGPINAYRVPDPWPRVALAECLPADGGLTCERRGGGAARLIEETPLRLSVRTSAEEPATLVLADTFYPGWEAALDGQPVPIRRASGAFRAVDVPAGEHEVTFTYHPRSLRLGALITGVALVGLIGLWISGSPGRPR